MQSIIPYLWCNNNAQEVVSFYTELFPDSKVGKKTYYDEASSEVAGVPVGTLMTIQFWICGQEFVALNGGDFFKFSPAVSLTVFCETEKDIDRLWEKLRAGGMERMPLQQYPFSQKYGWVEDKFGLSWQLNWNNENQRIVPSLLFVGDLNGRASEAAKEYVRIFGKNGKVITVEPFSEKGPDPDGPMKYCLIELAGQEFILMDGPGPHEFGFTGGVSFLVDCENQDEIDHFWREFTKEGKELPCGWATDKFGVHWQVFANFLEDYLYSPDKEKANRSLRAMYEMKKIIIQDIVNA